jgi:hypothetical protein
MPETPNPGLDAVHLSLLTLAYPAFIITRQHCTWRRPRWEIVRKNPADPGLYAVITPDLDELRAILAANGTTHAAHCPAAAPTAPGTAQ